MYRGYDGLNLPREGKWPAIMALTTGVAYLSVGVAQLLVALGLLASFLGPGDLVGGVLLIIVAAVFLTGVNPLRRDDKEGYAYIAVGYILAAVLFGLQFLVIITNALGWMLQFEDWLSWNLLDDLTPPFWMFVALMVLTGGSTLVNAMKEHSRSQQGGGT